MSIHLTQVGKSFGKPETHVLHEINLSIEEGELVSLTGKSGSGKSTLLYILSTLDFPTRGEVEIGDHKVTQMNVREVHEFRNLHMGFVFQFHHLLPELTTLENVLIPAMKTGRHKERRAAAEELLHEFGLADKFHRFPNQLSGGEQQRVASARSLVMAPKYLFADEPTGNLDSANGQVVMDLLKRVNKERQTTVIYVTHDPDFAALAPRQIQLVDGRVVRT